ncbi:hypothetical protein U724_19185 [Pseudomonas chlororaphis subsp. aurantiaca PB-St2]|nr:hypothetical protein U724_19185 [Pseudomonas chlororaphis subsp. aurantiaca PB-St2]
MPTIGRYRLQITNDLINFIIGQLLLVFIIFVIGRDHLLF